MKEKFQTSLILKTILWITFIVLSKFTIAQDRLYLKGEKEFKLVKIYYITDHHIEYKLWPATIQMPLINTHKSRVIKIIFLDGNTMRFRDDEWYCADKIYGEHGFALKFDQFAFRNSVYFLSAEYHYKKGLNFEIGGGYINWKYFGSDYAYDLYQVNGIVLRAGVKIINAIDNHAFNGFYVKPEITYINHLNRDTAYYWTPNNSYREYLETRYTGFGTFMNVGYQISYKDFLLFDVFGGIGIGGKTGRNNQGKKDPVYLNREDSGNFGYIVFSDYHGIAAFAMQAGFKIGFVIDKPKKKP